ncbi:MAG: hypothetical protein U0163_14315 [Gemmatimonadaceae bacterium]
MKGRSGEDLVEKQNAEMGVMPVVREVRRVRLHGEDRHFVRAFQEEAARLTFADGVEVVKMLMTAYRAPSRARRSVSAQRGSKVIPSAVAGAREGSAERFGVGHASIGAFVRAATDIGVRHRQSALRKWRRVRARIARPTTESQLRWQRDELANCSSHFGVNTFTDPGVGRRHRVRLASLPRAAKCAPGVAHGADAGFRSVILTADTTTDSASGRRQ